MKVIPINKTNPETIKCFLNCIAQYTKKSALKTKKSGMKSVKTDKRGKDFGAKKGKT
jgi:hypothetical protein